MAFRKLNAVQKPCEVFHPLVLRSLTYYFDLLHRFLRVIGHSHSHRDGFPVEINLEPGLVDQSEGERGGSGLTGRLSGVIHPLA